MCALSPSRLAASASMRPSWPPPRMPMVLPGGSRASRLILDRLSDGVSLRRAEGSDAKRKPAVAERQDLRRQQSGIGRAGSADGERADRDAGGQLGER